MQYTYILYLHYKQRGFFDFNCEKFSAATAKMAERSCVTVQLEIKYLEYDPRGYRILIFSIFKSKILTDFKYI